MTVGPCALEYTKMKTADHFWTDPSADELVQRHRIHGGHCRQDSPTKRPALCVSITIGYIVDDHAELVPGSFFLSQMSIAYIYSGIFAGRKSFSGTFDQLHSLLRCCLSD